MEKSQHKYQKRQRELAKKKKQQEKRQRREARNIEKSGKKQDQKYKYCAEFQEVCFF
jgi:hypothetical protein